MRKSSMFAGALALGVFPAVPAMARIVLVDASAIQGTNVRFGPEEQTGSTVNGFIDNADSAAVSISAPGGALLRALGGQGRVTGGPDQTTRNPNDGVSIKSIDLALGDGGTFNDLEFNIFGGAGETATFAVTDQTGQVFNFSQLLGNGGNFFGFQGIDGQSIRNVAINVTGPGFTDLRQLRMNFVAAIPEPESWAFMMGGFAVVGGMMRRRKPRGTVTYA